MPKSKKPKLTLAQGGAISFEAYKKMLNKMTQSLLGRPISLSDEELKERYKEFAKKSR